MAGFHGFKKTLFWFVKLSFFHCVQLKIVLLVANEQCQWCKSPGLVQEPARRHPAELFGGESSQKLESTVCKSLLKYRNFRTRHAGAQNGKKYGNCTKSYSDFQS